MRRDASRRAYRPRVEPRGAATPGGGAMSGITGSGKLNALSMSWVPEETISGIGAAEKVVHEILRKPPISVEEEDFKKVPWMRSFEIFLEMKC